jgi:hypothetical protein
LSLVVGSKRGYCLQCKFIYIFALSDLPIIDLLEMLDFHFFFWYKTERFGRRQLLFISKDYDVFGMGLDTQQGFRRHFHSQLCVAPICL